MIPALMDLLIPLVTPYMIVWADQNGPRPDKPYFTLKVSTTGTAPLHESQPDAAGDASFVEHRTLRCEIGCYGKDAVDRVSALAMRLRMPAAAMEADRLGVGVGRFETVRDLSTILNASQREERGMLEFNAMMAVSAAERVGMIEHVVLGCPAPDDHKHVLSLPSAATPPPSP